MEYIDEDMFETLAKNMSKKFGLSIETARAKTREALAANNVRIGPSLAEKIRLARVHSGELAVVGSLREHGLLDKKLGGE